MSSSTINGFVFGGYSISGSASNNTLNISGSTVSGGIYGGVSNFASASYNTITMSSGTINGFVYGGCSNGGSASYNTVNISGGTVGTADNKAKVYGGSSLNSPSASVNNNNVSLTGTANVYYADIYGGYSDSCTVSSNSVTVTGGTVNGQVYGGYSNSGTVSNNAVSISVGTVNGTQTTPTITGTVYGGYSGSGNVGIDTDGNKAGNTVTISGGTINGQVYGGYSNSGTVSNNTINISGGAIGSDVIGGYSNNRGSTDNNTINISGGTLAGPIYGGHTVGGSVNGNTINLSGGTFGTSNNPATICGGYNYGFYGPTTVANTIITLTGTANVTYAEIDAFDASAGSGNTLYVGALATRNTDGTVTVSTTTTNAAGETVSTDWTGGGEIYGLSGFDTINLYSTNYGSTPMIDVYRGGMNNYTVNVNNFAINDNTIYRFILGNYYAADTLNIYTGDGSLSDATPWISVTKDEGTKSIPMNYVRYNKSAVDVGTFTVYNEDTRFVPGTGEIGGIGANFAPTIMAGTYVPASGDTLYTYDDIANMKGKLYLGGCTITDADGTTKQIVGVPSTGVSSSVNTIAGTYNAATDDTTTTDENEADVTGGVLDIGDGFAAKEGQTFYGGYSESGSVSGSSVSIGDQTLLVDTPQGTWRDIVYGGYSAATNNANIAVSGNSVTMSGAKIGLTGPLIGGYSAGSGTVTGNTVTVSGGAVLPNYYVYGCSVYGGYSVSGNANDNTVNISNDTLYDTVTPTTINGSVSGGYSAGGNASGNTVNISGGTVGDTNLGSSVSGGYSESASANYNTVNISGGTIGTADSVAQIYGGCTYGENASANNNIVSLSGTAEVTNADIYGGYSYSGSGFTGNKLYVGAQAYYEKLTDEDGNYITNANGTYQYATEPTVVTSTIDADGNPSPTDWTGDTSGAGATVKSVQNFETINLYSTNYNNTTPTLTLTADDGYLNNTTVNVNNFAMQNGTYKFITGNSAAAKELVIYNGDSSVSGTPYYLKVDIADEKSLRDGFVRYDSNGVGIAVDVGKLTAYNYVSDEGGLYAEYTAEAMAGTYLNFDWSVTKTYVGATDEGKLLLGGFTGIITASAPAIAGIYSIASDKFETKEVNEADVTGGVLNIGSGYMGVSGQSYYGGYSSYGSNGGIVSGNSVSIDSADLAYGTPNTYDSWSDAVYGGYDAAKGNTTPTVSNNSITLSGSTSKTGALAGGWSYGAGVVSGNTVTVNDGTIYKSTIDNSSVVPGCSNDYSVLGGYSESGNVSSNRVEIKGGSVNSYIYGGFSGSGSVGGVDADGKQIGNSVIISGGTINGQVYGGYNIVTGTVSNNTVSISGGAAGNVYGGYSNGGDVSNNAVTISVGTVDGTTTIPNIQQDVCGGESSDGDANNNTVIITGGTIGRDVYGGSSNSGSANNNTVTISGGAIGRGAYGGGSTSGSASGNTVNISGGMVFEGIIAGTGYNGNANNNTVNISGGTIGTANKTAIVYAGVSLNGTASNNTINIGKADAAITTDLSNASLYGNYIADSSTNNNNNLNIINWSGAVNSINNFDGITFSNLTATQIAGADDTTTPILQLTESATLNNTAVTANVDVANLTTGSTLYLITNNDTAAGRLSLASSDPELTKSVGGGVADFANVKNTSHSDYVSASELVRLTNVVDNISITNLGGSVMAGTYIDGDGTIKTSNGALKLGGELTSAPSTTIVAGTYDSTAAVSGGVVNVDGNFAATSGTVNVYGGYSTVGDATNNTVNINNSKVGDLSSVAFYGGYSTDDSADVTTGNKFVVTNWTGKVKSLNNFGGGYELSYAAESVLSEADNVVTMVEATSIDASSGVVSASGTGIVAKGTQYVQVGDLGDAYIDNNALVADLTNVSVLAGKYVTAAGTEVTGTANDGVLTVDGNLNTTASIVAGTYAANGDVTSGTVNVYPSNIPVVYGGYSANGNVSGTTVNVLDDYGGTINTGYAANGTVSNNTVNVAAKVVAETINLVGNGDTLNMASGSVVDTVNATGGDNALNLTDASIKDATISGTGTNNVTMDANSTINALTNTSTDTLNVTGGMVIELNNTGANAVINLQDTEVMDAVNNTGANAVINLQDTEVMDVVTSTGANTAINLTNSTVGSVDSTGANSTVNASGSTISSELNTTGDVTMTDSSAAGVSGANITTTNTQITDAVNATGNVNMTDSSAASVSGANITTTNTDVTDAVNATGDVNMTGGSTGEVNGVNITTNGTTIAGAVNGSGDVSMTDSSANSVSGANVTTTNTDVTDTVNATGDVNMTGGSTGEVNGVNITTNGTAIAGAVNGSGDVTMTDGSAASVSGANVTLNGAATVTDTVDATGNVNINGNAVKLDTASLSGNTLNIDGWSGSVAAVENFQNVNVINGGSVTIDNLDMADNSTLSIGNVTADGTVVGDSLTVNSLANGQNQTYNFYVPSDYALNSGDSFLTVKGAADLSGSNINMYVAQLNSVENDDVITLISAESLITDGVQTKQELYGDFVDYEFTMEQDGNKFVARAKVFSNEEAKSPVETMLAATAMINQGSDMLTSLGFDAMNSAADTGSVDKEQDILGKAERDTSIFAVASANKMRYNSGSHIDSKGWNAILGLGHKVANKSGSLTFGPLVEYGKGNYDSYLDSGLHGEGDTEYVGGGLMAKQVNNSGVYYEGSVRAGRSEVDYKGTLKTGKRIGYDSDSTYVAAHLGMGFVSKLSDTRELDYYGKLFYTHVKGDDVTLNNGTQYKFDGVNSTRLRLGLRMTKKFNNSGRFYYGLAYQYEFNSDADAVVNGVSVNDAPSLKGSSGIGEIGYVYTSKGKYEIDLSGFGSVGKQRGLGAKLQFKWSF